MVEETVAIVLACSDVSLLERLTEQLGTLPVRDLQVVTRDGADGGGLADDLRRVAKVARASTSPVAVVAGDVVAHTEALAILLDHPSRSTGALVGDADPGPLRPPVRVEQGKVAAAGNSFHQVERANGSFCGVLQVGEDHLAGLADVAEELAELAETRRLGRAGDTEVADLLLTGLVRSGVPVRAAAVGRLTCDRVSGPLAADATLKRLAAVDEKRARLASAVKTGDGFFATFFVSSWSPLLVRLAARLRLTPNAVTGISLGMAVIAAAWFADGTRGGLIIGAAALYLSFVLDCVDGQLARYTRRFSPLGAWLDAIFDRAKEYAVYIGLALGYSIGSLTGPTGPDDIWALAVAALILQSLRHMIDFSYAGAVADAARSGAAWVREPAELSIPEDDPSRATAGTGGSTVVRMSRRLDRGGVTRWLKKAIVLPIGERMALISITAAVFNARVTFLALLGWGAVAALYTLTGRIARSLG
ncbi:CDP-alcohol phosphatidyltransferase family protein [Streptosporangiaceae bacterium NEAU-GS5]|nr:CDP-alcohol phosphatidyltransferase family protein [Streptosporangiaceae bacterium NEAU-GS5]